MELLLIFLVSLILQTATTNPIDIHNNPETPISNRYELTGKLKFVEQDGGIPFEPTEFVDLRLRYILNQSTSDIQSIRILQQEDFSRNAYYQDVWNLSINNYNANGTRARIEEAFQNSSTILEAPEEYHHALFSYTYILYYYFNRVTRDLCSALDIEDNYNYSSYFNLLHLAMETMGPEISRIQNEEVVPLYRGLIGVDYRLKIGQEIKFQQFTSTTRNLTIAERFTFDSTRGSIIEIQDDENNPIDPRHKISLRVHSFYSYEDEMLVSPFQGFVVHNITDHYNSYYGHIQPKIILKPKAVHDRPLRV